MRRCICGLSRSLPVCDGSHRREDWTCTVASGTSVGLLVAAAAQNANIAERLAHRLGGAALHRTTGPIETERLLVVTDGSDLDRLRGPLERVRPHATRVLSLGGDPAIVATVFPRRRC